MKKRLRDALNKKAVNIIYLVGEVVDVGVSSTEKKGLIVRARLKMRAGKSKTLFVYIDVYSQRASANTMYLTCQTGNIVYVEAEFRNAVVDGTSVKPYVLVNHIECLLRRKEVNPPSTDIIRVLDELDPIGYAPKSPQTEGGEE